MQERRAQNERYIFGDGGKDTWYNGGDTCLVSGMYKLAVAW
jgi:hypothetical protein